mmetsp:Transcript_14671/g.21852  ORF Transcript_14671/g.21852 Transcript_14671/m.21852 type:complete len:102 (-) Transcript_14671:112-417(-)
MSERTSKSSKFSQNEMNYPKNVKLASYPSIMRSNAVPIDVGLSAEKITTLSSFMNTTGADPEVSLHYLEAMNWQLDSTVVMYMDWIYDNQEDNNHSKVEDL